MGMFLASLLNFLILAEQLKKKTQVYLVKGMNSNHLSGFPILLNGYFQFISKAVQFSFLFHPLFITFICHFCHFVDLPRAAVRILSNMTFLFVSLSYTAESAIVTAFITFIPKFIESQFGIPASNASIYTGKALPLELLKTMSIFDH